MKKDNIKSKRKQHNKKINRSKQIFENEGCYIGNEITNNKINNETNSSDEQIDTSEYTKDTRNLILTDEIVLDIISNKSSYNFQQKHIFDAFRFLKNNKLTEFRKLITDHKNLINIKHNKTYLLHEACKLGVSDFVSLLLFLGAKSSIHDDHGLMAQHYAAKSDNCVIIDILALFGNNMNVLDMIGNTPLHFAIINRNYDIIKALMSYKADPYIVNKAGEKATDKLDKIVDIDIINMINEYVKMTL